MSGRGRAGTGPGAELARNKELVRTVGGSFGAQNIVGSRLRPRAIQKVKVKKVRKTAADFVKKVRKPREFKAPVAPKLLKVPAKSTVNKLAEIEAKNNKRLKRYQEKLDNYERRILVKEAKLDRKRMLIDEQINAVQVKGETNDRLLNQMLNEQKYCDAIPYVQANCALKKKIHRLNGRRANVK